MIYTDDPVNFRRNCVVDRTRRFRSRTIDDQRRWIAPDMIQGQLGRRLWLGEE